MKLLTRLRLVLSHLHERKFKRGFNDTVHSICMCRSDTESINHLFFHCPEYCEARQTFFDNSQSIDKTLLSQNESSLNRLLFYGDPERNSSVNAFILNSANELMIVFCYFLFVLISHVASLVVNFVVINFYFLSL